MSKSGLIQRIEADQAQHISFLQTFIRTPCPNPPGDTREVANLVRGYLKDQGIDTEIIAPKAEAPNVVSVLTSGADGQNDKNHHLILNGHLDHFPVEDASEWQRNPYSGDLVDSRIHGRGGVDMKTGTAALVIAFGYLHDYRKNLSGTCVLQVVSDEETGGKFGTRYLLENDARKDVWKGDCVLNTEPGSLDTIRFGEKGTLRMTWKVETRSGHGAYVFRNEGAIRIAARVIDRLVGLETLTGESMDDVLKQYLQREDVRKIADEVMGDGAGDAMLKPTVNIGKIQGGIKVNMIPATCVFEADIRLPIGLTADKILAKIDAIMEDIPEASYEVQEAASNPPAYSSHVHEMVKHIQANAERTQDGTPPLPICSMGATDCKHFRYKGVPAFTIGPRPDGMGERDESVSVHEFLATIRVITLAAWDYLDGPE
ncbi:hypothetical protein Q7P37_010107 [Cladosporium fusiforme]